MASSPKKSPKASETPPPVKLAIVRVRGTTNVRGDIEDTLRLLNLNQSNHCVIVDDRPQYKGMITKVNDYVTWGEISEKVLKELLAKRALIRGNKPLTDDYVKERAGLASVAELSKAVIESKADLKDVPNLKPVFRLKPPQRGFERAGIKKPYSLGGALGYRGGDINALLERMI